jgi:hypothetical protein
MIKEAINHSKINIRIRIYLLKLIGATIIQLTVVK